MVGRFASRMVPQRSDRARTTPPRRRRTDVVVVAVLIGSFALGLSAYGIVNSRFDRIEKTVASMRRIDAPMTAPRPFDESGPRNYAVFAVGSDGSLTGGLIVHLTAPRDEMAVIAVPADTPLGSKTLADVYDDGVAAASQGLEQLVGTQMDHQFELGLGQCADVVTAVGGLTIGSDTMDAARAKAYLDDAATPAQRADRLAQLTVAAMSMFSMLKSLVDPTGFDKTVDALQPCVSVDASLTSAEVRSMVSQLRIRSDTIGSTVWPGVQPKSDRIKSDDIKTAFAADNFSSLPLDYLPGR